MRRGFLILLAMAAFPASAEPWLCTEPDGNKAFNYDPQSAQRRECVDQPLSRGYVRRATPRTDDYASPADFPRVDAKTQKRRDVARREILKRELIEEQKALADAIREMVEARQVRVGAAGPAPAALKRYEDRIRVHQTNIANLQKELGGEG
jgi:hypothetical protein